MNAHVALKSAPRAACVPVRLAPARQRARARVVPVLRPVAPPVARRAALAPSAGARIEAALMGITFLALTALAVGTEAAGVAAWLF